MRTPNQIMHEGMSKPLEVGDGATMCLWSDRHAFTVVEIRSDHEIVVQSDTFFRTDTNGLSEAQTYRYERNPKGRKIVVTRRKNGRWVTKGESMNGGTGWRLGFRDEYYDLFF